MFFFRPIQRSNGVFSKTMSRFFSVIQPSNRSFHTYMKPGWSSNHPTGQKKNIVPFFSTHPTIQWGVFENYVPIFFGHPTIQQVFPHIYQTWLVIQPSNRPKKNILPFFFDPYNHPTGISTHISNLAGHPTIQQAKKKHTPVFFRPIQPSNRSFHTYIKPGWSSNHPTGQKKNILPFFLTHPTIQQAFPHIYLT